MLEKCVNACCHQSLHCRPKAPLQEPKSQYRWEGDWILKPHETLRHEIPWFHSQWRLLSFWRFVRGWRSSWNPLSTLEERTREKEVVIFASQRRKRRKNGGYLLCLGLVSIGNLDCCVGSVISRRWSRNFTSESGESVDHVLNKKCTWKTLTLVVGTPLVEFFGCQKGLPKFENW